MTGYDVTLGHSPQNSNQSCQFHVCRPSSFKGVKANPLMRSQKENCFIIQIEKISKYFFRLENKLSFCKKKNDCHWILPNNGQVLIFAIISYFQQKTTNKLLSQDL